MLEFKFGFGLKTPSAIGCIKTVNLKNKKKYKTYICKKNSDQNVCTYLPDVLMPFHYHHKKKGQIFVLLSVDENQWCFVEYQNSTLQGLFSISLITINALKLANLNRMCDFFGTTKAARTKLIDAHLSWHHRVRRQVMTVLQVRHAWFCYKQWMKIVGAQQPHTHTQ